MSRRTFHASVEVGHGRTHVVIVPFHPADAWPDVPPVKLSRAEDPRGGTGWPVRGTIAGEAFDGHVGHRYGRSYVVVPPALRKAAAIGAGDEVEVAIAPAPAPPAAPRRPGRKR